MEEKIMILNPARRKTTPRKKPTRKPAVRRKTTPKKRVTRRKPAARKTTPKRRVRRMKRNPVGINLVQDAALVAGGALAVRVLPQFIPQTKQFDNGIGGYAMNAGLAVLPMFFAKKASHKKDKALINSQQKQLRLLRKEQRQKMKNIWFGYAPLSLAYTRRNRLR